MSRKTVRGMACCTIASVIFGLNPILISGALKRGLTPERMVFWMNLSNCLTSLAVWGARGNRVKIELVRRQWVSLMLAGLIGIGGTGYFLSLSYELIGTGRSTVVHFMYPALVTMIMSMERRERINTRQGAAIGLSMIGVMLLTKSSGQTGSPVLFLPAVFSSVTYSFYLVKSGSDRFEGIPVQLRCALMCAGVWLTFGAGLLATGRFQVPESLGVGFLAALAGMSSSAGYNLLICGIREIGPSRAAFATLLEPLTGVGAGIVFGGERLTMRVAEGAAAVLASVWMDSREEKDDGVKGTVYDQESETEGTGTGGIWGTDLQSGPRTQGNGSCEDETGG